MKNKKTKILATVTASALLISMLAGCQKLDELPEETSANTSVQDSVEISESSEVSIESVVSVESLDSIEEASGAFSDSSESSESSAESTEPADSSVADSSVADSSVADSSLPEDSSAPDESSKLPSGDNHKEGLYYVPAPLEKDDNTKYIAFTFDDGPSQHTETLLNFLEEKGLVLTFFYVGDRLDGNDKYGAYVKRAVDIGCEPAIHCYTHENYFHSCSDSTYEYEVEKTAEVIYNYAGCYPITMRPPGGSITSKRAAESDYNIIIWSVDSNDWKYSKRSDSNVETIKKNILGDIENDPDCLDGKIVLLHDLYENSVEAFMEVAEVLLEKGYKFVTVSQLCELDSSTTVGKQYYSETYFK